MSPDFAPLPAMFGGALIGTAASIVLLFEGRVAGICGIVAGLLTRPPDWAWRVAFLAGLVTIGVIAALLDPSSVAYPHERPAALLIPAGLAVGFGTQLANGCTSGHGVCGLARLSLRSLANVVAFMGAGAVTAVIVGQVLR